MDGCEPMIDIINSRCSIRYFEEKEIPENVIKEILKAGTRAPTAGGTEQWFFIVIKNSRVCKRIHELLIEAHLKYAREALKTPLPKNKINKWYERMLEGMYKAPLYIAVYIDLRKRLYNDKFKEVEFLMAVESAAAAIENIILAAWSMGLGSVWLGVPVLLEGAFNDILKPPENTKLIALIALGYPKEKPRIRPRKPLEEVVKIL